MSQNASMDKRNLRALVRLKYEVEYRDPIQVKAGDSVEVGREDNDYPRLGLVSCCRRLRRVDALRITFDTRGWSSSVTRLLSEGIGCPSRR
jgi:hypothetical protein